MSISPSTFGAILVGASLLVAAMLLHYVWRAKSRTDMLCFLGLLAAQLGLLQSGRAAGGDGSLFLVGGNAFTLFVVGLVIWRTGLQRFRDAG